MFKKQYKDMKNRNMISCCTIGIMGLARGSGATHIGLSMAGFLSAYFGKKVLFVEALGKQVLHHLLSAGGSGRLIEKQGISYLLDAQRTDLLQVKNLGYSCCILDLGTGISNRDDFMRCDIKVMVGMAAVWQKDMWLEAEKIVKEVKDCSSFHFLANLGSVSDDVRKKLLPAKILSMPYEPNLPRISEETTNLFRRVFINFI